MRNSLLIVPLFFLSVLPTFGATVHLTNISHVELQAAVSAAATGDIIHLHGTNDAITVTVNLTNKAVTIQGDGTNSAFRTVIKDTIATRGFPIFEVKSFTNRNDGILTFKDIFFERSNITNNASGPFIIQSQSPMWKVSGCFFNDLAGRAGTVYAPTGGLIANNTFINGKGGIYVRYRTTTATAGPPWPDNRDGHDSWSSPPDYGSTNMLYIEYNTFINLGTHVVDGTTVADNRGRAVMDGDSGTRYVFRYNEVWDGQPENHEMGQHYRGPRLVEIYGNNSYSTRAGASAIFLRGGSGLVFSNNFSGVSGGSFSAMLYANYYRFTEHYFGYAQSNGTNLLDLNATNVDGSIKVFDTGTHTGTNGSSILVDTNKSWTPGQWQGFHFHHPAQGQVSTISASRINRTPFATTNTATTVTFKAVEAGDSALPNWTNGQPYSVYYVVQAMDQVGIGSGDAYRRGASGLTDPPTNQVSGTVSWMRPASEPLRMWANTGVTNLYDNYPPHHVLGTNYIYEALAGYTPLGIHPLSTVSPPMILRSSTLRVGTIRAP